MKPRSPKQPIELLVKPPLLSNDLVKQSIKLLTKYSLLPDDLIVLKNNRAMLIHYKNFDASNLEETNQLMCAVLIQLSEGGEPLSLSQFKQMKSNFYNMAKAVNAKCIIQQSKHGQIVIDDLKDPSLNDKRYKTLKETVEELLVITASHIDKIKKLDSYQKSTIEKKVNREEKHPKTAFIHPHEERLLTISLEKLLHFLDSIPFNEFKMLCRLNSECNQLNTNKQGYLTVSKQGFISRFFNTTNKPALKTIKDALSKTEIIVQSIKNIWPTNLILEAFPKEARDSLKERFYMLSNFIQGSMLGLAQLKMNHEKNESKTNSETLLELDKLKKRILMLGKEISECEITIPAKPIATSIMQLLNNVENKIDMANAEEMGEIFDLLKNISKACQISLEESIVIQEKTKWLINKANIESVGYSDSITQEKVPQPQDCIFDGIEKQELTVNEYVMHAENLADIGTHEDYAEALYLCENINKIFQCSGQDTSSVQEKILMLQLHIRSKLQQLEKEELLDRDISRSVSRGVGV